MGLSNKQEKKTAHKKLPAELRPKRQRQDQSTTMWEPPICWCGKTSKTCPMFLFLISSGKSALPYWSKTTVATATALPSLACATFLCLPITKKWGTFFSIAITINFAKTDRNFPSLFQFPTTWGFILCAPPEACMSRKAFHSHPGLDIVQFLHQPVSEVQIWTWF